MRCGCVIWMHCLAGERLKDEFTMSPNGCLAKIAYSRGKGHRKWRIFSYGTRRRTCCSPPDWVLGRGRDGETGQKGHPLPPMASIEWGCKFTFSVRDGAIECVHPFYRCDHLIWATLPKSALVRLKIENSPPALINDWVKVLPTRLLLDTDPLMTHLNSIPVLKTLLRPHSYCLRWMKYILFHVCYTKIILK